MSPHPLEARRVRVTLSLLLALAGILASGHVRALEPQVGVAHLEQVRGDVRVSRASKTERAQSGIPLQRGDRIETGVASRAIIGFADGSRFMLGGDGAVVVEDVLIAQGRQRATIMLNVPDGAFRLMMAEPPPGVARMATVRTRYGVLSAARGDVWAGPKDGGMAVLVVYGRVEVRNDRGSLVLDKKRSATLIAGRDAEPRIPAQWQRGDVDSALLTVSFD